jgi:hypothetical protein
MHYLELDNIQTRLDFFMNLAKANKLHEPHCVAFTLPKDHAGSFGTFASAGDKYCHCWLDYENRAPEGEAFGIYDIEAKELQPSACFLNQFYAVEYILQQNPHLSKEPSDENYWRKTYYVLPVTLNPTESTE